MDALDQLATEFEALGEAAVAERLNANVYQGPARAVAMRWLNEKTLARASVEASVHAVVTDLSTRRIVRAERGASLAMLCAAAALLVAVGSVGVAVHTQQALYTLSQSIAAPPAPAPAPTPVRPAAPAPRR